MAVPSAEDLSQAQNFLSPASMALFLRLQPSEQAHSLRLFQELRQAGEDNRDLLAAALLHDVGKSCASLYPWERVLIVLGRRLLPARVKDWGQGPPIGWRRPFVVAEQHPAWGAELAAAVGASPLAVALIRRHQERGSTQGTIKGMSADMSASIEDQLLQRLQSLDDES